MLFPAPLTPRRAKHSPYSRANDVFSTATLLLPVKLVYTFLNLLTRTYIVLSLGGVYSTLSSSFTTSLSKLRSVLGFTWLALQLCGILLKQSKTPSSMKMRRMDQKMKCSIITSMFPPRAMMSKSELTLVSGRTTFKPDYIDLYMMASVKQKVGKIFKTQTRTSP